MDFSDYAARLLVRHALIPISKLALRTLRAHWSLKDQMPKVNRCWNKVRGELAEVGLLYDPEDEDDGGYLDQIDLAIAFLPSHGEAGYVYDHNNWFLNLVGFEPGVIYLPPDLPQEAYVPGNTLTDVIRHEYAHAWHWVEPGFFKTGWFTRAFGGEYAEDDSTPFNLWLDRNDGSRSFQRRFKSCRNDTERNALIRRSFQSEFVSEYASEHFCEDFAETFMFFLRNRRSLSRFRSRQGVFKKLKAVEQAVNQARKELGL